MAYIFEIHLTVDSLTKERLPSFEQFCQTLGGQAVLIQLPVGEHTQQPMFTMTEKGENLAEILAFIDDLKPRFVAENFSIIRTKLEIPAHQANEFLLQYPDTNGYFEWHGKVSFQQNYALQNLRKFAKDFNAHLSHNALKNFDKYRFITYRSQQSLVEFQTRVANITTALNSQESPPYWFRQSVKLEKSQSEFCVFDSNLALDEGWDGVTNKQNLLASYQTAYPQLVGIGGESYDLLEEFCIYEALIRRSAKVNQPFMLKGSYVTRQYFDNTMQRMPVDVDFACLQTLPDIETANQVLTDWLIAVTRCHADDGVYFVDFAENAFWRMIDYAMHDDFPTVQTDIECYLNGKKYELWVEVSFNLDIPFEPIPLLYKTPIDEFVYPKTVPLALQIAWKIHQSIVRPRLKDIYDLTYLAKKVDNPQIVQDTLQALLQECRKDNIAIADIMQFFKYDVAKMFDMKTLQATWKHQTNYYQPLNKSHFPLRSDDMKEFFAEFKQNMQQAGFSLEKLDLNTSPFYYDLPNSQKPMAYPQPLSINLENISSIISAPLTTTQPNKKIIAKNAKMGFVMMILVLAFIGIWIFIQLKFNTP